MQSLLRPNRWEIALRSWEPVVQDSMYMHTGAGWIGAGWGEASTSSASSIGADATSVPEATGWRSSSPLGDFGGLGSAIGLNVSQKRELEVD